MKSRMKKVLRNLRLKGKKLIKKRMGNKRICWQLTPLRKRHHSHFSKCQWKVQIWISFRITNFQTFRLWDKCSNKCLCQSQWVVNLEVKWVDKMLDNLAVRWADKMVGQWLMDLSKEPLAVKWAIAWEEELQTGHQFSKKWSQVSSSSCQEWCLHLLAISRSHRHPLGTMVGTKCLLWTTNI
jgi:hypothetical protein